MHLGKQRKMAPVLRDLYPQQLEEYPDAGFTQTQLLQTFGE